MTGGSVETCFQNLEVSSSSLTVCMLENLHLLFSQVVEDDCEGKLCGISCKILIYLVYRIQASSNRP